MTCLAGEDKEAGKEVRIITAQKGQDEARLIFAVLRIQRDTGGRFFALTIPSLMCGAAALPDSCLTLPWPETRDQWRIEQVCVGLRVVVVGCSFECCFGLLWVVVHEKQRRQEGWKTLPNQRTNLSIK